MKTVVGRIDTILNGAQTQLANLAEEYRRAVLIPLCSKHRLTYLAGMGRTLFSTEDGVDVGNAGDARDEGLTFLVPVFAVLDKLCLGTLDDFGFYVDDITKRDWLLGAGTRRRR